MPVSVSTPARTDAGLASELRVSVMRLARRLRNEREASADLTPNQLAVLGTLSRSGPLSVGELAAAEKVQPPSMTRTVTAMCDKGLVTRDSHADDKRLVVVSLTDDAQRLLAASRQRKDDWLDRQLAGLTSTERQTLRAAAPLLEHLSQA